MVVALLIFDLILLAATGYFIFESIREQEPRAPKVGLGGAVVLTVTAVLIVFIPESRLWIGLSFGLIVLFILLLLHPGKGNAKARAGVDGYVVSEVKRFDERDEVFARNRSLPEGSKEYDEYYSQRPEQKVRDDERRAMGGSVGKPGAIDSGYPPNVAMMDAAFAIEPVFGPYATPKPDGRSKPMDPATATKAIKGFAKHLGADLVGVCRTDPRWVFSRRGEIFYDNWEDWGKELPDPLPYALIFGVEMDHANVACAPHTPSVIESAVSYAKGSWLSTIVANWFSSMGYQGIADNSRHYTSLMVPLAVQAGLGELGRQGYLIADQLGPRVRLFAVTTDMELVPDEPVDLGADEFCRYCKKCAESCPSKSLPLGGKTVNNGVEKWKMDEESCFRYWAKIGGDCSVCMAICPFSRPNTPLHQLVRWLIKRSNLARKILPHIDNVIYGRRWHPRKPTDWISYSGKNMKNT